MHYSSFIFSFFLSNMILHLYDLGINHIAIYHCLLRYCPYSCCSFQAIAPLTYLSHRCFATRGNWRVCSFGLWINKRASQGNAWYLVLYILQPNLVVDTLLQNIQFGLGQVMQYAILIGPHLPRHIPHLLNEFGHPHLPEQWLWVQCHTISWYDCQLHANHPSKNQSHPNNSWSWINGGPGVASIASPLFSHFLSPHRIALDISCAALLLQNHCWSFFILLSHVCWATLLDHCVMWALSSKAAVHLGQLDVDQKFHLTIFFPWAKKPEVYLAVHHCVATVIAGTPFHAFAIWLSPRDCLTA